ncbi:hypothetical protein Taro_039442 [Colocasia esculenta]|uniref:Uncharacterized protein n=1 Tax=Colocasia esculenta TaxID=4460 RepID=A0A843WIW8_COLES|nr:hypothetical protein [Colocasia esculenta]
MSEGVQEDDTDLYGTHSIGTNPEHNKPQRVWLTHTFWNRMAESGRLGESDPADRDPGRVGSVDPADSNGVWPTLDRPDMLAFTSACALTQMIMNWILEITHHYVEILDCYFGSVSPQKNFLALSPFPGPSCILWNLLALSWSILSIVTACTR